MEQSVIIQLLLAQEKCVLEKKQGIYYLNGKNIHPQIQEFLKVLIHSTKQIQSIISRKETLLRGVLDTMKYYEVIRDPKINLFEPDSHEEEDQDEDQEEEEDDDKSSKEEIKNVKTKMSEDSKQKQKKKSGYKLQNADCQQILDSLEEVLQSKQSQKPKYYEQILDNYQSLQLDIILDSFSIEFASPFLLKNPLEQINLTGSINVNLSYYYYGCSSCDCYYSENLQSTSKQLLPLGVLFIEQLRVWFDVGADCAHNYNDNRGQPVESDIVVSLKGEECLKFKELVIDSHKFELCEGYKREVTITQDENLKRVVIPRNILTYTNFIQDNNRFLTSLFIMDNDFGLPTQNLQKELQKLRFSEVQITPVIINKCVTPSQLNSLDYLIYLKLDNSRSVCYLRSDKIKSEYTKQIMNIFNKKYSNILSIFSFDKLFGDQFSLFRLMFDLYEFDYQLPLVTFDVSEQVPSKKQKTKQPQKNVKSKKK